MSTWGEQYEVERTVVQDRTGRLITVIETCVDHYTDGKIDIKGLRMDLRVEPAGVSKGTMIRISRWLEKGGLFPTIRWEPLVLPPCPFCEGPPVPIVTHYGRGGEAKRKQYPDGLLVEAYVFCHECGAQGPSHDPLIYDEEEYDAAEREAVRLWMERGNRNRDLYDACGALNHFPRG